MQNSPICWFSGCKRLTKNQWWWVRLVNGNIILPYKDKTGKNTVIEDVEDEVDKIPDSYFFKAAARVFDKLDNEKSGILPF